MYRQYDITRSDIRQLHSEALAHGDTEMAEIAATALQRANTHAQRVAANAAWQRCGEVITTARANS